MSELTNNKSYVVMMHQGDWDEAPWWPCAVCDSKEAAIAIRDGFNVALNQPGMITIEEVERNPVVPDLRGKGILWRVQDVEDGVDPDDYVIGELGEHYIEAMDLDPGTTLHHLIRDVDVVNAYETIVLAPTAEDARVKAFGLLREAVATPVQEGTPR